MLWVSEFILCSPNIATVFLPDKMVFWLWVMGLMSKYGLESGMGGMVTGWRGLWRRRRPWSVKLFRQGNTHWYKIHKNTEELWNTFRESKAGSKELECVCGGRTRCGGSYCSFLVSGFLVCKMGVLTCPQWHSVVTRIKISRSCAAWGLCWSVLLRGGGVPDPAWLHAPSLSLLLICLPRAGGLYLIWKKETFVLAAARIKYVMTFFLSQGLLLFSNARLSFPPMETGWTWIIHHNWTRAEVVAWRHQGTDSQHHSILKLKGHLF